MSTVEPGEVDADFILPLPPDITVMSEVNCQVDTENVLSICVPEECFFPCPIDDALDPDNWLSKESEQKRTNIDDEEINSKVEEFMELTYTVKSSLCGSPLPDLRELGFDCELPKKGSRIDILRLLSLGEGLLVRSGGEAVRVEEALGEKRYILLCCVFVPVLKTYGFDLRALSNAIMELKELHGDDFVQGVIVPFMLPGWEDNKGAFDRLFDTFPECLTVPFDDIKLRDLLCMVLNLRDSTLRVTSILVDSQSGEVLLTDDITPLLGVWGAGLYPFTEERIDELSSRLYEGEYWLEYLLDCSSSHLFQRLSGELVQVSDLRNKYVGLYLYVKGRNSIDSVLEAHTRYKDCGLEILVVTIPLHDNEDPYLFQEITRRALLRFGSPEWFLLPFKDFTSRKLFYLFPQVMDHLVIMDPVEEIIDPCGLEVLRAFGVDSFPFTRDHIIQTKVDKLMGLTLKSMLSQSRLYRNNITSNLYSPDSLDSGVVFVYFTEEDGGCAYLDSLRDSVQKLRSVGPEIPFEVVVVLWAPTTSFGDESLIMLSEEAWLICPVDEDGNPPSAVVELASEKSIFPRGGFLSFLNGQLCAIDSFRVGSMLGPRSRLEVLNCMIGSSGVRSILGPGSRDETLRLEVLKSMIDSGLFFMDPDDILPYTLEL